MSDDLTTFLLERIADDVAAANKLSGTAFMHWRFEPDPNPSRIGGRVVAARNAVVTDDWSGPTDPAGYVPVSPHIARHDPARVLADCKAKLGLIDYANRRLRPISLDGSKVGQREMVLRLLAIPYRDHPDYRQEWD